MEWQQHIIPLGDVVPPRGPWACTYDYLPWFYKVSHPYVILLEEGKPPCDPLHLPLIIVQSQPWQPLADYVPGGNYSCQVMQIGFC